MTRRTFTTMLTATLGWAATPGFATIDTGVLLDEMTDLPRLTRLPDPAYTTKQFSSYDRASKTHSDHEGWFANRDHGHYLRVEQVDGRSEHVMMDAEGPGAVVRIWSPNPAGTLRIYLDGNPEPAIEADMSDFLAGRVEGFPEPIGGTRARGWNLYFPIAYQKHCKITSDHGGFYYLVNYRTYERNTSVRTFTMADVEEHAEKIVEVAKRLSAPREGGNIPEDRRRTLYDLPLRPGQETTIWQTSDGPKAIVGFLVRLEAEDMHAAGRSVVVVMNFDGQQTVECPIGDFFGFVASHRPYAYQSLPLGVVPSSVNRDRLEFWSHWWMPFATEASITLKNLGEQNVRVHGGVSTVPYDWDDRSLLFHAKWRIERQIPARPFSDWMHMACRGEGRFVGGGLHIVNPVKAWWGEGDEKIYVDGETFPSHFGTGSEDYYGYGWCDTTRFEHAYHNQPSVDGPANFGNTLNNRFHIIDDIPFTTSFKFDMENWHWDVSARTTRAAVSFWYARPGGSDFFGPILKDDVRLDPIGLYEAHRVPGAIEGEHMTVLEKSAGDVGAQDVSEAYSGEQQIWWRHAEPGDRLTLAFNAEEAGRANVVVRLTHANDYAIVQLYVNGQRAGEPIDLYKSGHYALMPELDLGAFHLRRGQNTFTVEIVGRNPDALDGYMFGMDYLILR